MSWLTALRGGSGEPENSAQAAALAGSRAPSVGRAFAAGYQGALERLTGRTERMSLLVTEAGGGHPKALQARVEGGRVWGTKVFGTLADEAQTLLVAAWEGEVLRVVAVPATAASLAPGPEVPFLPDVHHAVVTLDGAQGELLPGDGYSAYVKPFRTLEDLHVIAAVLGWWAGREGPPERVERVLALLAAVDGLARLDPLAASTHRALAGLWGLVEALVAELPDEGDWARDRAVLNVARGVRAKRAQAARERWP